MTTPNMEQVARYGHIAIVLREGMARLNMTPAQINEAMGRDKASPSVYRWIRGLGAPDVEGQKRLAHVLGVRVSDVAPRKVKGNGSGNGKDSPVIVEAPSVPVVTPPAPPRQSDSVMFSLNPDGNARIRLDMTLPGKEGIALLQLVLGIQKGGDGDG